MLSGAKVVGGNNATSSKLMLENKWPCNDRLSRPVRNERGESRREGHLINQTSSPRPSPPPYEKDPDAGSSREEVEARIRARLKR